MIRYAHNETNLLEPRTMPTSLKDRFQTRQPLNCVIPEYHFGIKSALWYPSWQFTSILPRYDGVTHGYIGKDATSNRSLQSLTCRILLCQKACLELLMNFMEADCLEWPVAVRTSIRESSSDHKAFRQNLGLKLQPCFVVHRLVFEVLKLPF